MTNCLWDIPWRPSNVLALASAEQRERYLLPILRGERFDAFATTEPDSGSDAGAIATTATPVDGGWLLNGEKWFVTCGDVADFLLVQANVLPDNESTLFFVEKDTPGVRISRTPHFMHSAVNGHPEFVFENVFVPTESVLGEVGQGFELTKDWFTDERLMIAARTVGVAERALKLARDWAIQRKQFGVPISDFQMIQAMLADCAVDIAVNRAYTHQVAWEADNGVDRKTLHAKASIAKLSASEAAGRVVDRCLQIFGGRGYDRAYPDRADVPRGARRPHLGRHLGDPACHRRQRTDQARHGVPRSAGGIDEPGIAARRTPRDGRLVTGGGTGIGRAVALDLARCGADVVICGSRREPLEKTAAEIEALGARVLGVPTDIREDEQVVRLVDRALERFGRIDTLVNNAGGQFAAPPRRSPPRAGARCTGSPSTRRGR